MATSLSSLSSNFFPSAQNGFTTTLASTISSGATTVPLNSVAGYTNGEVATFIVDPSDATKKQTFTGVIDTGGVQVTSVVWTAGTNQSHTSGATVVDYATATHISQISKGILVHADQDGTLKAGAVDVAGVLANSVVTTDKINDLAVTTSKLNADAVTAAKLADDSVFPVNLTSGLSGSTWAWQSWTPTITASGGGGPAIGDGTYACKYTQIGKTVICRFSITLGSTTTFGSGIVRFSVPVTPENSGKIGVGSAYIEDAGSQAYLGMVELTPSTSTIEFSYHSTSGSGRSSYVSGSLGQPFTWGVGDYINATFTYEAD